jgi:hypothetical protein
MKKILLLLALSITVLSCQKEEISTPPVSLNAKAEIIGTWQVDAVQLWDGHTLKEVHTPNQTIEFTAEGSLFVTGEGVGGSTLTDTLKYTYEVNAEQYFLRIVETDRIYQGCLIYLRPNGNGWELGFSRPTGSNTNILWNYHCTKK